MKKCKKENNQITKEKLCPIAKVQRFGDKLNGFINTENCKIVGIFLALAWFFHVICMF